MNTKSKWEELKEENAIKNKLKEKTMNTEKQTKRQWVSIIILAIVELLTKLNVI